MSDRADTLALHYLTIDEPATARQLLRQYGSAGAALAAIDAAHLMLTGVCGLAARASDAAAYGLVAERRATSVGATLIVDGDDAWPAVMADLGDTAPLALYVRGNVDVLAHWREALAISGARASTGYGNYVAGSIAGRAAEQGVSIVTGGAFGIAAAAIAAHLGNGTTPQMIVMSGGVERAYPQAHDGVFASVLAHNGALVSEFPPGSAPHRTRFVARNRLIAAAGATVIAEAAARSGALMTARHALELGRPLGAVPGPITSAGSIGCHSLIRDGHATLIHESSDALALLDAHATEED